MILQNKKLPSEYQKVEYLESTGTQYIDTEFVPNERTCVELDCQSLSTYHMATPLMGCRFAFGRLPYFSFWFSNTSNAIFSYGTLDVATNCKTNVRCVLKNMFHEFYYNGTKVLSERAQRFQASLPIFLFGINENGSIMTRDGRIRVYHVKIWDENRLVRDFVPCCCKLDSELGLYDLVNGKFYTNQGTGEFLKGMLK